MANIVKIDDEIAGAAGDGDRRIVAQTEPEADYRIYGDPIARHILAYWRRMFGPAPICVLVYYIDVENGMLYAIITLSRVPSIGRFGLLETTVKFNSSISGLAPDIASALEKFPEHVTKNMRLSLADLSLGVLGTL